MALSMILPLLILITAVSFVQVQAALGVDVSAQQAEGMQASDWSCLVQKGYTVTRNSSPRSHNNMSSSK
jgi:hypothetical protein